jgi:hypothetical protein
MWEAFADVWNICGRHSVHPWASKNRADMSARSACALLVDQNFTVTRAK